MERGLDYFPHAAHFRKPRPSQCTTKTYYILTGIPWYKNFLIFIFEHGNSYHDTITFIIPAGLACVKKALHPNFVRFVIPWDIVAAQIF